MSSSRRDVSDAPFKVQGFLVKTPEGKLKIELLNGGFKEGKEGCAARGMGADSELTVVTPDLYSLGEGMKDPGSPSMEDVMKIEGVGDAKKSTMERRGPSKGSSVSHPS